MRGTPGRRQTTGVRRSRRRNSTQSLGESGATRADDTEDSLSAMSSHAASIASSTNQLPSGALVSRSRLQRFARDIPSARHQGSWPRRRCLLARRDADTRSNTPGPATRCSCVPCTVRSRSCSGPRHQPPARADSPTRINSVTNHASSPADGGCWRTRTPKCCSTRGAGTFLAGFAEARGARDTSSAPAYLALKPICLALMPTESPKNARPVLCHPRMCTTSRN